MTPEIIHSTDFINDALKLITFSAEEAIAARGEFRISLSGGNTPKPIYQALAEKPMDWSKWIVTFGDERCVPPDSEESNYRMAKQTLFDRVSIPSENILRMRGEEEPHAAAREYEEELRRRSPEEIFRHDLLLLGMGPDGHTASLFPWTHALPEAERWVVPNYVPKFSMWRLTFTYPLINAARHVCFLVSKKGKEKTLEEVFSGQSNYPCAKVRPSNGKLTWLIGE